MGHGHGLASSAWSGSSADRRRFIERTAEECQLTPEAVKRDLGRVLLACEQWQQTRQRLLAEPATAATAALTPALFPLDAVDLPPDL